MNKPLGILTILLLLAGSGIAKKPLQWKTGKVLDTQRNRYFARSVDYGAGSSAVYRVFGHFVIDGEDYAYEAKERVPWHRFANLTVNGPAKYAVDGRKLVVIDDDGKQHVMEIVKRVLKPKDAGLDPAAR